MYVRPLMIGSGPQLGLGPSNEFTFMVIPAPVGSYYKAGKLTPIPCMVMEEYDRAAPQGVGSCKCAGNYAADIVPAKDGKYLTPDSDSVLGSVTNKCLEALAKDMGMTV